MAISESPAAGPSQVRENSINKTSSPERNRGEGNVYLRNNTWWIRYSFRGKPKRESSHSSNQEDALKLLNRRMKEIWADRRGLQTFIPKAEKVYVDELLDELEKHYKLNGGRGLPQFRSHIKPIRAAFGDKRAVDASPKVVDDYIDDRLAGDRKAGIRPRSPATINRETQLLGQAFSLGIERRVIITAPHIRYLPERNVRQGFFDRAEFEAVVGHLPEYLQDLSLIHI